MSGTYIIIAELSPDLGVRNRESGLSEDHGMHREIVKNRGLSKIVDFVVPVPFCWLGSYQGY
jgi:hypothetical protein